MVHTEQVVESLQVSQPFTQGAQTEPEINVLTGQEEPHWPLYKKEPDVHVLQVVEEPQTSQSFGQAAQTEPEIQVFVGQELSHKPLCK